MEKAGKRSPRGDGREVEVSSRQILPEPVIMKLNLQHGYQNKERNTTINKTKKTNKNRKVKKKKEVAGQETRGESERERREEDGRKKERTSSDRARAAKNDERSRLGGPTGTRCSPRTQSGHGLAGRADIGCLQSLITVKTVYIGIVK